MHYAKVLKLPRYFRNLQRLGEIVAVLGKHGFGDLVHRLGLNSYLESGLRVLRPSMSIQPQSTLDFGERLRLVCEELGSTFIKFAQVIATRPDVFPDNVIREFRKLQDRAAPFPYSDARLVIEHELGKPVESIFADFNPEPLAAASIAQVHKAALPDGSPVVVKIQRPNLDRIIETDIEILMGLATLIEEHIPESRQFGPLRIVEEFARGLRRECDFRREANNIKQFARQFSSHPNLCVPRVYDQFSSRRVLVEEFIIGTKSDDVESVKALQVDTRKVVVTLSEVVLSSIFEHRFFHADPHPGNVLITPDGRVALIDFGAMGRLDTARVFFILRLLVAVLDRDLDTMIRILCEAEIAPTGLDEVAVKAQLSETIDHHLGQPLGRLDLTRLLGDVFDVIREHGIRPPPDLLLIGKSITLLVYIAALLDPSYDPLELVRPYLMKRFFRIVSDPKRLRKVLVEMSDSYRQFLSDLPRELRVILRALSRENLLINYSSRDLPSIKEHQNRIANRMILAVLGVCFLSFGILWHSTARGEWSHTLSYAFVILGGIFLILVLRAISRSGGVG